MQASDEELMAAGCKPAPSVPAFVVPSPSELSPTEPALTEPSQSPAEEPKLEAWVEAMSLSDECYIIISEPSLGGNKDNSTSRRK